MRLVEAIGSACIVGALTFGCGGSKEKTKTPTPVPQPTAQAREPLNLGSRLDCVNSPDTIEISQSVVGMNEPFKVLNNAEMVFKLNGQNIDLVLVKSNSIGGFNLTPDNKGGFIYNVGINAPPHGHVEMKPTISTDNKPAMIIQGIFNC